MRIFLFTTVLICAQTPDSPLRFEETPAGRRVVARLPMDVADKLPAGKLTQEQGEAVLTVSLLADDKPGPAMLGKYERIGPQLSFMPRFAFVSGEAYRAKLLTPGGASLDYTVPAAAAKSPPKVVKVYPSTNVLPANHLRFYIYFDRPMRGGKELFEHLIILDDKGKRIAEPWLEDQIWDEANNCLILFIHPGRIKWGVEMRQLLGPVLREDRSYTFIVRGEWTDLDGNKMGKDFVKRFSTSFEDRVRIELKNWKLTPPAAGSRDALELTLPKSIDYRSLFTGLAVVNAKNEVIEGEIAVGKEEKSWRFTPKQAWQAGEHRLRVDPDLEDVAGNTPTRPFDYDLTSQPPPAQRLDLPFAPK